MAQITRIEVIDENGRSYVNWDDNNDVQLSYQDDGRTLKVFVNKVIDPVKEAFKKVYGGYPKSCSDPNFIIFKEGYNTARQDYKVEEATQERGERIHKEVEELLSENENEWKSAALKFGRKFPVILPYSYDELPPEAWLKWATCTYEKTPHDSLGQAKKDCVSDGKSPSDIINEWVEKNKSPTLYEILMEWWVHVDLMNQSDESIIDNLIDLIDDQFIPPHHDTNDYQWNKCLKLMREKLR